MLTVAVLGPVQARRDGVLLALPAGRTTEVLVRLALDAGQRVAADRLIEDVWAGSAADTARNTLQSKISQLRRALGDSAAVRGDRGGYTLAVEADGVDALRVVRLAAAASAARRCGDAAQAIDVATSGLALFRGEALVDAGDGEWLRAHRVRLDEVRLGLVEDLLAARVDLGAGGDVIGELEALVEQHPLREGLWSSLITALYRAGRQAEALAAYTRVRDTLVEELGIEPGPGLRALERQVLQQSPVLDVVPVVPVVPVAPADVVESAPAGSRGPGNLPGLSAELVGRARELAELADLLRTRRLVTLVGPAGVGKSRTALDVARQLGDVGGVWLVRLDAAEPTRLDGDVGPDGVGRGEVSRIARLVAETPRRPPAAKPFCCSGSPVRRRRSCWTAASTSSGRLRYWPNGCWTRHRTCGCWRPARSRSGWTARPCTSSSR